MPIKWLDDIDASELSEKTVLCRLDLNVPIDEAGNVSDATRIELALATIRKLLKAKAKVVICSHLGRPKGKFKEELSLEPVASYLRDLLNNELTFVHDCVSNGVLQIIADRKPGDLIFLENMRFHPGEEKNDPVFAKMLARGSDIYVNDAFGAIHRAHASVDGVTHFFKPDKCLGGLLLKKELTVFDNILHRPKKPLVAVIGGAKVSSKIGVLSQLLKKVDAMIIGGAMAYTFLHAKGENVGKSLIEEDKVSMARSLLNKAAELDIEIYLPVDHVVADKNRSKESISIIDRNQFLPEQIGYDIGPKSIASFEQVLASASTVFWNGPMGLFEDEAFSHGTSKVAKFLASSKAYSVVGGGDSISALKKAGVLSTISFVSSGGGALLELLEGRELPGLKALGFYDV